MNRIFWRAAALSLLSAGVFQVPGEAFAQARKGTRINESRKKGAAPRYAQGKSGQTTTTAPAANPAPPSPAAQAPADQSSAVPFQAPAGGSTEGTKAFIRQAGNPSPGKFDVSPMLGYWGFHGWYDEFDLGARAGFRIMDTGFVPVINNSVAIDSGLFYRHRNLSYWGIRYAEHMAHIPVYLRWDFHVHPSWTVFAMAGPAVSYLLGNSLTTVERSVLTQDDEPGRFDFEIGGGVGAFWRVAEHVSVRMEVDRMVRVGAGFHF